MRIKWEALFRNEEKQFSKMTEAEKFAYFLVLQFWSPYMWGRENPEGSDCSGAVCLALCAATGLLIRTSADDLYRRVFTVRNPGAGSIRAAFFITQKEKPHGDRMAAAGTAVHVAGLVDEGVILNSQAPGARVRPLAEISAWFGGQDCETVIRGLDKQALIKLASAGNRYGLDAEISRYFEK
jgi:murein DD-endopeptidase